MANSPRRTQAERRAETQAAVLESACRLFGERGFAKTSLEDIGADCGVTIAPIYHYFGNKKKLFAAVNARMENKILESMRAVERDKSLAGNFLQGWRAFLELCKDPGFRQIVLIDSPNILGKDRWQDSEVSRLARENMLARFKDSGGYKSELITRMVSGALAEASLLIAEAEDPDQARKEADELVSGLVALLESNY
mgnify:CR=1 FL=1